MWYTIKWVLFFVCRRAVIDCTASDSPPGMYLHWMKQGLNIITPNKKLGSGPLEQYQAVRKMQRESYIHFFYEVCAICACCY